MSRVFDPAERDAMATTITVLTELIETAHANMARLSRYHNLKDNGIKPPVGMFAEWRDARNHYWSLVNARGALRAIVIGRQYEQNV